MPDLFYKRHSQAHLQMLFYNISPLGNQAQPRCFFRKISGEASQGHLRSIMSDVLSESRASSLAKGFESTAPAWLAQAQPCASSIIRANPAHPWLKNDFAVHDFAKWSVERRESSVESFCHFSPLLSLILVTPEPHSA